MHEFGITQQLLQLVLAEAEKAEAKRILNIKLVVGELTAIIDESVQFYFDMLSEGTAAQGAVLSFEHVAAEFCCSDCHQPFTRQTGTYHFRCPHCGGQGVSTGKGKEFYVSSMEVE